MVPLNMYYDHTVFLLCAIQQTKIIVPQRIKADNFPYNSDPISGIFSTIFAKIQLARD